MKTDIVDPKQKMKQQTLQQLGVSSTTTTTAATAARLGNQNSHSNVNVKSAEQALLLNLYPATNNNNARYLAAAPTEVVLYANADGGAPLPTPPLPPTTALASARVPASTSLFTSAAHCKQVTDTLEARLEKRRTEQPPGSKSIPSNEELGRGGVTFPKVEESRALKSMKLRALKEELRTHESTVLELKRLIAGLEAELEQQ